ncbi:putative carboxypeptidase C [Helianthus annuus]|nr:putative carboxypeptidase C [Helianthus annuus]
MGKSNFVALLWVSLVLLFLPLFYGGLAMAAGTQDGSEKWGYVEVRPKAHMFWWYYKSPYRTQDPNNPWPIILWLQGGPGASGVGIGNFEEVGPLDSFLKPRNSTWLRKADLLFVDNPVGTGYSYVEDEELLVKTDEEAATDLTTLLIAIFNKNETLQKSPLYIVAESYGGKYAVTLGLSALKAIEDQRLKLILGGIALGDSWISPEDFVESWGPLLKDVSRIDDNGLTESNSLVEKIKLQIANGKWTDATQTWSNLESLISDHSNGVDFYNFLLDSGMDPVSMEATEVVRATPRIKYIRYLDSLKSSPDENGDIGLLMNGDVRKKLGIIPNDVKWEGLKTFLSIDRTPLYCGDVSITKGFTKSYRNLHFYWILGAGHFVPVDQPCIALEMVVNFTRSLVSTK